MPAALQRHATGKLTKFQLKMMELADVTGTTAPLASQLALEDRASWENQQKLKSALIYPIFTVSLILGFLLVVLPIVIFPQYLNMLEGLRVPQQGLFKVVVGLMQWTQSPLAWLILSFMLTITFFFFKSRRFRQVILGAFGRGRGSDDLALEWLEGFSLKYLPPIGRLLQMVWMIRFCRSLEVVHRNSVSILSGLHLCCECSGSALLFLESRSITQRIKEGQTLCDALAESRVVPALTIAMLKVGEEAGSIPEVCAKFVSLQEDLLERYTQDALTLLEPLLIGLMGLAVGSIVLLTLYPIIEVIRAL